MEDDKPFACPSFDCGMRFANEDHLSVHKQKHEMSLTLTSSVNLKTSFVDQTPTPTRFLSTLTALESELFQEFPNYNPFEATFRKENSKGTNSNQLTVPEASTLISSLPESDVLNTPSITLTSEVENAVFTKQRAISNVQAVDVSDDTLPFTPSTQMPSGTDLDDLASNNNSNAVVSENCDTGVEAMSSTHSTVSTTATTFLDAGKSDPIKASGVQTPVITSVGLPGSMKSSVTSVPMAVVVTKAVTSSVSALSTAVRPISVVSESPSPAKVIDITPPVLPSISVAPVVQLIIRLPDGQSMPFQIPVSIAPAPPVNVQPIKVATNTPSSKTSTSTTQSLTKMKLREVLTLSRKSSNGVNGNTPNNIDMEVGNSYPSFIAPCQNSSDAGSINDSPPSSPQASHRSGSTGGRRRDSEGDPDEKRRKSLERNRAAAIRCREKRKQWIVALEKKAEELAHTNVQLQNEVSMLRSEVSQLKSMLLAHKDCPITLQQKASSFCGVTNSHTVPIHVKRSQSPAAQVAERTRLTSVPIQVEVMDVEVNSSGSGFLLEVSDSSSVSEPRTPAQGKFHEAF